MTSPEGFTLRIKTVTGEGMRGGRSTELPVDQLRANIAEFLDAMSRVLAEAPEIAGQFHLDEVEVHAEIAAKGQIVLVGVGGEVGATGGLRFVFKRS